MYYQTLHTQPSRNDPRYMQCYNTKYQSREQQKILLRFLHKLMTTMRRTPSYHAYRYLEADNFVKVDNKNQNA